MAAADRRRKNGPELEFIPGQAKILMRGKRGYYVWSGAAGDSSYRQESASGRVLCARVVQNYQAHQRPLHA